GADNRNELAGVDRQIDPAQHFHPRAVITAVGFADLPQVDQGRVHSASMTSGRRAENMLALGQTFQHLGAQAIADAGAYFARLNITVRSDDLRSLPLRTRAR